MKTLSVKPTSPLLSGLLLLLLTAGPFSTPGLSGSKGCPEAKARDSNGNYVVPGSLGDIPFRAVGGRQLLLDAFVHPGGETRPGVILIHGGGWTAGSRRAYISHFQELLTDAGFNWFAIDYRLAPAFSLEAQIEDIASAVAFVRCHADFFKIDPERLALLGEDTGAYLAAQASLKIPQPVRANVLVGGVFELGRFGVIADDTALQLSLLGSTGTAALAEHSFPRISGRDFPPTLVVHGSGDTETPIATAREFCGKLSESGGTCQLISVKGGIHRSENWTPGQWGYREQLVAWLRQELGPVPPSRAGHTSDGRLKKDIVYSPSPGSAREGLLLDAFIPEGEGPFPAVIVVHGGGWEAGSKTTYIVPVLATLAKAGFAWFSIDYRLTPEFENRDQLEDVRRAIRFIRHHAADYRVDPSRLALLGESAGGQLAVQVGALPCSGDGSAVDPVDRESCQVAGVVSFYGVYDFEPLVKDATPRSLLVRLFKQDRLDDRARSILREYSPYYQAHSDMPPLLLIHGTSEFLWDQAVLLARRLDSLGVDYQLVTLEGAPHGMENWEGHPEWETYKTELVNWLRLKLSAQ